MPCIFRLFGPPEKQQLTKPQKCRFSALRNKARKGSRAIHHSQKFLKSTCKTFRFVKKHTFANRKHFCALSIAHLFALLSKRIFVVHSSCGFSPESRYAFIIFEHEKSFIRTNHFGNDCSRSHILLRQCGRL